jgi:hypothetical protein
MMTIDDSQLPFIPAWEGELATSGATFTVRGDKRPQASIGQPTYWPLTPPAPPGDIGITPAAPTAGGGSYGLVRIPFSLRPGSGHRVTRVEFTVALYPSGGGSHARPTVYDAYPPTTTVEQEGEVSVSLGPDLKFGSVDASLAKVEGTLKLKRVAAAITVDGLGESDARWTFLERGRTPLLGSLVVYAVLALPPGLTRARTAVRLSANMNTPLGNLFGRLPDEAEAKVNWVLA